MSRELNLFEAPLQGVSLVEASAGTGKTYNIVSLYIRVILEKGLLPPNILVLTYTEAATAELKTRLRNRLQEAIQVLKGETTEDPFLQELANRYSAENLALLEQAFYSFDEAAVSTIHGFCQRVLKEESIAFNISGDFEILPDDSLFFQEQTDRFWRGFFADNESNFQQAVINFIHEKGYTPERLAGLAKEVISKPFTTILPSTGPIDSFESQYSTLRELKREVERTFLQEEALLEETLQGDSLNRSRYRNPSQLIAGLKKWLQQTENSVSPYSKLALFGSFMTVEGKGLKKGKEIPEFKIWANVDEYLKEYSNWEYVEVAWLKEATAAIHHNFQLLKKKKNVLSYQDLLEVTYHGLQQKNSNIAESIRSKYPIALVDEFQDTDPIQYAIFSSIYKEKGSGTLFMIGDPKQAIYSFRGADIFTYLKAQKESPTDQRYSLMNNHRSSYKMINAVNEVFSLSDDSFVIDRIDFHPAQFPDTKDPNKSILSNPKGEVEPLQFIEIESKSLATSDTKQRISNTVANEIIRLLQEEYLIDGRGLTQKDIAVLVRTHNQALLIQSALSKKGLKSIIKSKESVFHSDEANDLFLILSAITNPSFESGIRAALATEALGFKAEHIWNLLENELKWEEEIQKLISLSKIWSQKGISALLLQLDALFSLNKNYAKLKNAERKLTNLFHLIDLLSKAEQENGYSPNQLVSLLKRKMKSANSITDDDILRLESDGELIQILTMHTSKGLEFPVVFCPYLWEGIDTQKKPILSFHKNDEAFLDISTKERNQEHSSLYLKESLAERVRLTYVSLTRAKSACFVILADGSNSELSPLASLFEGSSVLSNRLRDKLTLKSADYKSKYSISDYSLSAEYQRIGDKLSSRLRPPVQDLSFEINSSEQPENKLQVLEFERTNLHDHLKIASFSSLTTGTNIDDNFAVKLGFDYDSINSEVASGEASSEETNMFSLPKGPKTGTLLHEVFEEVLISPKTSVADIITSKVQKSGMEERWIPVLNNLVQNTLSYPLRDGISLGALQKEKFLIEMEFHFPVHNVDGKRIKEIIRGNSTLAKQASTISGYMKGYIDLLFNHDDKYYILDYKSNYLGDSWSDYSEASLQEEILHSDYDLQYHIYSVAVHRMLKNSLPDYNFNTYFGGVIYLFLRGINPENPTTGIFFSQPDESTISKLDESFKTMNDG